MKRTSSHRRGPRSRSGSIPAFLLAAAVLLLGASPTAADEYRPQKAGHPLRIVAYVLHPVGVVLDVLILRPAHWLVSNEGLDEFFGHEKYDD